MGIFWSFQFNKGPNLTYSKYITSIYFFVKKFQFLKNYLILFLLLVKLLLPAVVVSF